MMPVRGCPVTGVVAERHHALNWLVPVAGAGWDVVGRSRARGNGAVRRCGPRPGGGAGGALRADLSSQQQVGGRAGQFGERHARLDVLVNNAGGMWLERRLTGDGLEMTFAV